MHILTILIVSIIFQLISAYFALRMIPVTRTLIAWVLIASAIILMVLRRSVTLYYFVYLKSDVATSLPAEWIALLTSILMLIGIYLIRPIFQVLKESEEKIKDSEERFRTLAEFSSDCIYWLGPDQKLIYISPACVSLTGFEAHEFYKNPDLLNHMIHPVDRDRFAGHNHDPVERETLTPIEYRIIDKTGKIRWVSHLCRSIFNNKGEFIGIRGANRDITEHKQAESDLSAYARDLARSKEEMEQFAFIASHDLQGPLRTITNYVQLLERRYTEQLDDKAKTFIAYIVDSAKRMQALINDFLLFSRVGRKEKPKQVVELNEVLEDVVADLSFFIEEVGAKIIYESLPAIFCEPVQIRQLFQNLIENALKFKGTENPMVEIKVDRQPEVYIISVKDNGIGIDPQYADRIFGIFQRLHTREEYPGTGVGLAVCKKIVEVHQGRIWVESQSGCGATFYVSLPCLQGDNPNGS